MDKDISVLMSVYKNDIPENVEKAVESVVNQTLSPKQIVMVVDGPVPDKLMQMLKSLEEKYSIYQNVFLEENGGLGNALKEGTKYCKYEFIARMDSDDISVPERFEKEMSVFENDKSVDLVGSNGQEFYDDLNNLAGVKCVPETNDEIVSFMKSRCPFCHMSVMMKKSSLIKAGGYQTYLWAEDWFLWIRMYLSGARFYNIQENLVYIRINLDTFARRSGLKYYKNIKGLLKFMKKNKMIGFAKYQKEKLRRFVGHVLVPNKLKNKMYRKFLRKN